MWRLGLIGLCLAWCGVGACLRCVVLRVPLLERKKEIPYKRAFEGHRVHSGYTFLSLKPKMKGWVTSVSNRKERKKSLTIMRACKGHRVLSGYVAMYRKGGSLVEGN